MNLDTRKCIYSEIFRIRVLDMARDTLIALSKSNMVASLDIVTGFEDSGFEHPRISVIGFGKPLLFILNSKGPYFMSSEQPSREP